MESNDSAPMSSTPNPTPDPHAIATLAPDVVLTRADFDVSKPELEGKTPASVAQKAAAIGATVPTVDTTFRAASASSVRQKQAGPSLGRRLKSGAISMVLTACLAGAAVLWQSHGAAFRPVVAKWVPPFVLTWLSPPENPAVDQTSTSTQASAETAAAAASTPQGAVDNFASTAASPSPESAQLLQAMARELAGLRQDTEQMKAEIAALRASRDQMASESIRVPEPNPRPKVAMVPPPPAQTIAAARKPLPTVRPIPPVAGAVSSQAAAYYTPRRADPRAVAPPSRSAAAPPVDLSAPLRPPAPLREQMP